MFAHCKGELWHYDDFSPCFRRDYLETLFPLIVCALSVLYLSFQVFAAVRLSKSAHHSYAQLKNDGTLIHIDEEGDLSGISSEATLEVEEEDDEESEATFPQMANGSSKRAPGSVAEATIHKPRGERILVFTEEIAVLAVLAIHIAGLVLNIWGHKSRVASITGVATWAYIAMLTSSRLLLPSSSKFSFSKVWYHTAFLYCFEWLFVVFPFRSEIIHPRSQLAQTFMSVHFALISLLSIIALTSRRGNKIVVLQYEENIPPSREPLASVFSLATFSWIDPIIWTGYTKVYEMEDVWNLIPKEKAAAILADYRQVKKTSALAYHLLYYNKRALIIQGLWAAISGVITFVPTLLLKVILEYVEDPDSTPANAAWLYVILLFASGAINATSSGQALWIGRKVCIRLRAIIIGEIYAKALRRRTAATADKVLGASADLTDESGAKKGFFNKIFGKKQSKEDKAKADAAQKTADESQVTSGAIINLMAVDSSKISEICAYLHFLWAETPVQFALAIYLLYEILGASSIVGLTMMALLLPVNMIIAKQFASTQKLILAATDARIHTTNEVLTNIRIIKYFAWEQRFLGNIDEKRREELKHLRYRYIVWAAAATIWSSAPVLITLLTFLFYTMVEQKPLVPSIAFTALSLFSLLRIPLDQLADMVAHVQEAKISVDRVEEYLAEPETEKYTQLQKKFDEDGEPIVGFSQCNFSWGSRDDADDEFKLIDLDMRFAVGELNVIVGPTGCGKTSLLLALLGEMTQLEGAVYLPGGRSRDDLIENPATGLTESVAYCAQQAWLINGTIKDNILFASKWDPRRYKQVIVACSLQRDLEILDGGDQTLVGEKGVTLSGGQKQRISLARALYSHARHVIMDDVLSAVDAHTAKWIFDKALMGPLMHHRTCILVTHNATLVLPHAEFAVVMDNGRVTAQGSANEVINSGKLAEDLSKFESRPGSRHASTLPSRVPSDVGGDNPMADTLVEEDATTPLPDIPDTLSGGPLTKVISKDVPGMNSTATVTAMDETKATGGVKLSVILSYLGYMGGPVYWTICLSMFALQQVSQVSTNWWIRQWANQYSRHEAAVASSAFYNDSALNYLRGTIGGSYNCLRSGSCAWDGLFMQQPVEVSISGHKSNDLVNNSYFLGVYAALGFAFMVITLLREGVLFGGSLQASSRIHRQLMTSVTHARFRFFDSTPLGQIMNRFSKDIEAIDQEVAPCAVGVVHCLFSILTIVTLISVITPAFLIAAVFISVLYFIIGKLYINASRDLKRLDSVQRSPLYQQFGETLSGMTTIRAYGDERRFIRENEHRVNTHSRPFLYSWAANRWLAFRVDIVGALVSFFSGMFVILSVGRIDAGAAGLAMSYAVTFTENVLWFVRLYGSNEQNMNSVERVKEYLDVEQEAPQIIPDNRPEPSWPSQGSVEFVNYSTRYRKDFDFVLKDISFKILPGEKVGVVGRTGAGKSSLALALFRALEAEEGQILVDDLDIGKIGLQDLRENIVMVPQDPTLFTGTIRSNLDPFGLFTDEEIFTALRKVQLIGPATGADSPKPLVDTSDSPPRTDSVSSASSSSTSPTRIVENKNIFRNLASPVSESGSNLSQGQRQLLCLARALLKAPKVLLMDEATASIDYATDAKIQGTLREIRNTTLTIAHRLQTIIDYDKVLVLDRGRVVEWGAPADLLDKDGKTPEGEVVIEDMGVFRGMCEMSGDLEVLVKEARKAQEARRLVVHGGSVGEGEEEEGS
jgi:ABC-type multidrug transport system fused ATPase/permease subunit